LRPCLQEIQRGRMVFAPYFLAGNAACGSPGHIEKTDDMQQV